MLRGRFFAIIKSACRAYKRTVVTTIQHISPVPIIGGLSLITASCEEKPNDFDAETLEHEFLIRQATTVNVNAATQLLTVTLVAIQDTSERVRDALTKEICLVQQALEWGDEATPPQHWDQLIAVRGALCDLKHNLQTLFSYLNYAEKLATTAAEISYLSGNMAASDAICERIDNVIRTCNTQKQLTHNLQQESWELQQRAIIAAPQLEEKLKQEEKQSLKKNPKPKNDDKNNK